MLGGVRKRIEAATGQQALLAAIWKLKGGVARIARMLGISVQGPINWRNRGGVPLVKCKEVAAKLKISEWGLNYTDMRHFFGDTKVPNWETVVKNYGLPVSVIDSILKLPRP